MNIFNVGSVAWSTLCVCVRMCVCHYNEMIMKTIKYEQYHIRSCSMLFYVSMAVI